MNNYVLNGKRITDLDSLYAEFGRAVNAPEGYFGKSFDSFDDCLFGGFGLESPCKIIWENSAHSKDAMNSKALEKYCMSVIESSPFLHQEGHEEGKEWAYSTLRAAQAGSRTLFDEVVESIRSVPERASWEHKIELHLK
ncbi:barstar family protein [Reinekea sp. G2M2-21]|uniref:barstar family protein n=1 Tax=Reinekea sp. G2M2-21 TaxID=2788942 RepID=UPI0018A8910E|nr:barstar family protein [Reinekea sp. G2M2-21]